MLIFNNLLINKNSDKFKPFLLNLFSGRRRLLNNYEVNLVRSICNKRDQIYFNEAETNLYNSLILEKQFLTDENRQYLENKLIELDFFDLDKKYNEDYSFSVELTSSCNMNCSYCYVRSRLNSGRSMTEKHIDSIFEFYRIYSNDQNVTEKTPFIRITGGEPLFNKCTVDLINYIASKWDKSKLLIFTNGVNILKYYDDLPLSRIEEFHVSIDGIKTIHMKRRFEGLSVDNSIYDNIISGVKKLLNDNINVKIKTTLDKNNYMTFGDFISFLEANQIIHSPYCEILPGITLDYNNSLDLSIEQNNKYEIKKIHNYVHSIGLSPPTIPSYSTLFNILNRPKNEPYVPKHVRCNSQFLSKYYFGCNGKIYHCDCVDEKYGIIGTYYPNIGIDESFINVLKNRSVLNNSKCISCAYKFVCLGGCPISSRSKNTEMTCGIYADEEILDNLEFEYL